MRFTKELTEEQRQELMQRLRELKKQAKDEGWTKEQFKEAIKALFAEYGIDIENYPSPKHKAEPHP